MKTINKFVLAAVLVLVAWAGSAHAQVNTVYGQQAAASEQYSANISIFGYQALYACQYCYGTTALGFEVLRVSSGSYNTGAGFESMVNATSGYGNTAVGAFSLTDLGSGSQNLAMGYNAGSCATVNGSSNVWIANCGLAKDNAVIRIGTQGVQKFTQIAGIYDSKVIGGRAVVVDSKGHLGYAVIKVVPNTISAPASVEDVISLRQELAALKNQFYALQTKVNHAGTTH